MRERFIVAAQQNDLRVLFSYCNSFFIRDVHGEFGLINVHLFDMLPAISSRKVREKSVLFFCLESGNPVLHYPNWVMRPLNLGNGLSFSVKFFNHNIFY